MSTDDAWREFFTLHNDEFLKYLKANYPWRHYDPETFDARRFERDPKLDDYFNTAVLENLGPFGFRRLSRSFKSEILSRPTVIKWDKGTWSLNMSVWIAIPTLAHSERIGMPFAMSAASFDHSQAAGVETQLHAFFREYGKIFPDVMAALDQGIRAQEGWLTKIAK